MSPEISDAKMVSSVAEINDLPRQLSPTILAVLLEDLVEYNGICYRTVPLRTFRGKYIGLYFGAVGDARCEQFLEHLRGFYIVMNHKFECVLVSSDGTDRDYEKHTQLTMWPTYPRGDYRPALLRNHFEIKEVPVLIILDSHGVVVTSNAVSKVDDDHAGFPWAEKVIDNTFGDSNMQGRLMNVLEALDLPPASNGIPALQHQVVGLIFGELWCPDARELMTRLDFLLKHIRGRVDTDGQRMDRSQLAVYFVHQEDIQKYSCFLNFKVPFSTLHLRDEEQTANIHHYLGVTDQPVLYLVSPREGWIVKDGDAWLRRDPTGVCFPWQPRNVLQGVSNLSTIAPSGYVNILAQLNEDDLNRALCHGPVFVALLHNVHRERREAIATLRAAAVAYAHRVSDRTRIMRRENVDLMGSLKTDEPNNALETLRRELSRPSNPGTGDRKIGPSAAPSLAPSRIPSMKNLKLGGPGRVGKLDTQGKVLWRVLQNAVEKQSSLHGSAPWNSSASPGNTSAQHGLSFFYSTEEDRTTQVLNKFCCGDVRQLQQHQAWRRAQAQLQAKEMHQRTEMMQQFDQVTADASQAFSMEAQAPVSLAAAAQAAAADESDAFRGASFGGPGREAPAEELGALGQPISAKTSPSNMLRSETPASIRPDSRLTNATNMTSDSGGPEGDNVEDPDDVPVVKKEEVEEKKHTTYVPGTNYAEWNDQTQTLLGDNHAFNGTGLIIDACRGCYYICGSLTDKETILNFLDAWDQGNLDSFEIRMPNDDEIVKDDEADMEREMSIYSQQVSGLLEAGQNVIPGIVIWIPTLQHSESHMGPEHLFRALLNLAFQRCPREDKVNAYRLVGSSADPDDDDEYAAPNKSTYKKLTPWIEKLWIFGLLDTDEAKADTEAGTWDPPSSSFLSELHTYVDELLKTMSVERREDVEDMMAREDGSAGSGRAKAKARRRFRISPSAEDMLIPHSDLFDEGLGELRRHVCTGSHYEDGSDKVCACGNVLMPDAIFCRKCGTKVEQVDTQVGQADPADFSTAAFGLPSIGNYNLCMRTARNRRDLHAAMLDELSYHSLVQYLPPPLFVLFVGDLPPAHAMPWPTAMNVTHLHVLGNVPGLCAYREISPALNEVSWASWAEGSADASISPTTARHIAVPFFPWA